MLAKLANIKQKTKYNIICVLSKNPIVSINSQSILLSYLILAKLLMYNIV